MSYVGSLLRINSVLDYYIVYFSENIVTNMVSMGASSTLIYYHNKGQIRFNKNVFYNIGCFFDEKGYLPFKKEKITKDFNIFND